MKKIILLFIFFPLFIFSQSKKHLRSYEKIVELIQENNIDQARSEALKLINQAEDWKKPHLLMASIYQKEGRILESANEYLKVYDLERESSSEPLFVLSKLLYENAYYSEALKYFIISSDLNKAEDKHQRFIRNCEFSIESIKNPVDFIPNNMGKEINSEYSEYLPYISANGQELIITRRLEAKDQGLQEDLFSSYRNSNGEWSTALPMSINTSFNEGSVTVSADKRFLIYTACNREDGFGSCDLYICVKDKNGLWSQAKNLGNKVNTRYWESQACFSPDGQYLYFVSNRRGGFGGDDIWRSKINRFGFSEPENLGAFINTQYNEKSPFIHSDNLTFYFASEGHIGMGDFDLFVSRRDNIDMSWSKPNNLGYPINSHTIENSLVVDPDGKTAYFTSSKDGFGLEDIFYFDLPEIHRANKLSDLEMQIIVQKEGSEFILHNVLFEIDSYILKRSSFKELNILFEYLQKYPSVSIHIEGHTDNVGDIDYNQNLSENRALQVYSYLLEEGISKSRLSYQGYGEMKPIASNETKEGRELNRRTSFVIIP